MPFSQKTPRPRTKTTNLNGLRERPACFLSPEKLDVVKLAAIESLSAAPPDKALPLVEQVLRSEKNPDLLKAAALVRAKLKGSED